MRKFTLLERLNLFKREPQRKLPLENFAPEELSKLKDSADAELSNMFINSQSYMENPLATQKVFLSWWDKYPNVIKEDLLAGYYAHGYNPHSPFEYPLKSIRQHHGTGKKFAEIFSIIEIWWEEARKRKVDRIEKSGTPLTPEEAKHFLVQIFANDANLNRAGKILAFTNWWKKYVPVLTRISAPQVWMGREVTSDILNISNDLPSDIRSNVLAWLNTA